jgi:GntR family transcriptional regulator
VNSLRPASVAKMSPARPDLEADWWTTTDVANYLDVTVGTVSTYRARGQMPPPEQTVGRTHVWRPATIVAWHEGRPNVHARLRHSSEHYRPASKRVLETAFTRAEGIAWDEYELGKRFEHIPADEHIADLFEVEPGTLLLVKHFVFFSRGEPRQMARTHLLAEMVDGTPVADFDREPWPGGTIDQMRSLGVTVTEIEETVGARSPTPVERKTLGVPRGVPVLAITRRMFADEKVVEVNSEIVLSADRAGLSYRWPV